MLLLGTAAPDKPGNITLIATLISSYIRIEIFNLLGVVCPMTVALILLFTVNLFLRIQKTARAEQQINADLRQIDR